jgi:hypothetical protein
MDSLSFNAKSIRIIVYSHITVDTLIKAILGKYLLIKAILGKYLLKVKMGPIAVALGSKSARIEHAVSNPTRDMDVPVWPRFLCDCVVLRR